MLKGKKSSEDTVHSLTRTKLPLEAGIRTLSGIKELLAAAESSRGNQIELEWTTGMPSQSFVLDVQWDINADDPIWSLYEENDKGSKKLWSQSFAAADLELFYDVLVMSCGAPATTHEKLSDILKPKSSEDKEEQSKRPGGEALSKDKKSQPNTKSDFSLNINSNNNSESNTQLASPLNQPGTSFPPTAYPPSAYNMPPGVGGFPMSYSPVMAPGQAFIASPVVPPPGWAFTPLTRDNAGNIQPAAPVNPYVHAQPTAGSQPLSSLPIDTALVNKRYEISLADLLKQSDLISPTTLAAALKMQTLIQDGEVPVHEAIKILKQHHQKGDSINTYINTANKGSTITEKGAVVAGKAIPISKEKAAAFDLLEKAGLLSKDDIATAKNVGRKHGGDLISILKAAQKLDDKTFEAALTCVSLLKEELMKLEQCIIALNYCSRSRVGFDEALEDLNWPNPRH